MTFVFPEFEVWFKYPFIFLIALLVTLVLTPFWVKFAARVGIVDTPDARRIHKGVIARGGGVVVFLAFNLACAAVYFMPWRPFAGQIEMAWWVRFLGVSSVLVAIGLADDRWSLAPPVKLLGQVGVAILAYMSGIHINNVLGMNMPGWLDLGITVLWFLLFINAFNLIDGMDGLATGLALVAATGLGISLLFRRETGDVLLFLALMGACLGFLRYNFSPASVFLGDSGSMFLGFTIAALSIETSSKGTAVASVGIPLLAAGIPVLDVGLAVWRRSARAFFQKQNGVKLSKGDVDHLHHRLLQYGFSQRRIAVILYGVAGILAAVGVLSQVYSSRSQGILLIAFLVGIYVVVRHIAWIELWDTGAAVMRGLNRPNWRNRSIFIYPVLDALILGVALVVAVFLPGFVGAEPITQKARWLAVAPFGIGLPFMMIVMSRAYSRVWSMARLSEYVALAGAVTLGVALGFGFALVFRTCSSGRVLLEFLTLGAVSVPLVLGVRAFFRVVQDAVRWANRHEMRNDRRCRTLVVGVGYLGIMFLRHHNLFEQAEVPMMVTGLVSDDPSLRGRYVHGCKVYGTYDELSGIIERERIHQVVIVEELPPAALQTLLGLAATTGLKVSRWNAGLVGLTGA